MAPKYRKVDPRIWSDEKFATLTEGEKLVAFYCLTSRQLNRCGLFVFSPALAAEELGTSPQTFRERFRKVRETFGWGWDEGQRVLYLPSWWKFNPPENPNVFAGNLNDLHELPQTRLLQAFLSNTAYLPGTLGGTLAKRYPKPTRNQEQEQEQEQEQDLRQRETAEDGRSRVSQNPVAMTIAPATRKAAFDPLAVDLPHGEAFRTAWADWVNHRREKRQPLTATSVRKQLAVLTPLTESHAVNTLNASISNGWTGLFPGNADATAQSQSRSGGSGQKTWGEKEDAYFARMAADATGGHS